MRCAFRRVLELGESGRTPRAGRRAPHRRASGTEIAEEEERLRRRPFLAHEQHRHLRQQQIDGRDGAHRGGRRDGCQAFAKGAVADLVVVLDEGDEGQPEAGRHSAPRVPCRYRTSPRPGTRSLRRARGRASRCPRNSRRSSRRPRRWRRHAGHGARRRSTGRCKARGRRRRRGSSRDAWLSSFSRTRWICRPGARLTHALRQLDQQMPAAHRRGSRGPRRGGARRSGTPRSSRARCG